MTMAVVMMALIKGDSVRFSCVLVAATALLTAGCGSGPKETTLPDAKSVVVTATPTLDPGDAAACLTFKDGTAVTSEVLRSRPTAMTIATSARLDAAKVSGALEAASPSLKVEMERVVGSLRLMEVKANASSYEGDPPLNINVEANAFMSEVAEVTKHCGS